MDPSSIWTHKYESYIWYIWCRSVAQQNACFVLTACSPSARSVLAQNRMRFDICNENGSWTLSIDELASWTGKLQQRDCLDNRIVNIERDVFKLLNMSTATELKTGAMKMLDPKNKNCQDRTYLRNVVVMRWSLRRQSAHTRLCSCSGAVSLL